MEGKMKNKILTIFAVVSALAVIALSASATVLVSDDFSYSNGSLVTNSNENWTAMSTTKSNPIQVVNGVVTGITNTEGNPQKIRRNFSASTTGMVYARMSLQVTAYPSESYDDGSVRNVYGLMLGPSDSTLNSTGRGIVWFASPENWISGYFRLGLSNASSQTPDYTENLAIGDWYDVILATSTVDNTSKLWVGNLSTFSEDTPTLTCTTVPSSIKAISSIRIIQNYDVGTNSTNLDNLVVGDSFSSVVPEPSSLLALVTGAVGLIGFETRRRRS